MKFEYNSEIIQDNINEFWETVSLSSFIEGKQWYWVAHTIAQDMADTYNVPIEVAVGIISSLSPQKSWEHNIELAKEFFETEGKRVRHTGAISAKARLIYHGYKAYNDRKGFIERVLNGPKIVSFFNNILNPYDNSYICIDRHHLTCCLGDSKINTCTLKQYEFLRQETLKFAKKQNLLGSEAQAILWVHVKNSKNENNRKYRLEN